MSSLVKWSEGGRWQELMKSMHTMLNPSISLNPQHESQSTPPASLFLPLLLGPHWRRGPNAPFGNVTDLDLSVQSETRASVAAVTAAAVGPLTGSVG